MRQVFERPTTSTLGIVDPQASRFALARVDPVPDLSQVVERHWVVRWDLPAGVEISQAVIPHPSVNLVAERDLFAAHGIPSGLFVRTLRGSGAVVGTKFRPGAGAMLLGDDVTRPDALVLARRLLPDAERVAADAVRHAEGGDDVAAVARVTAALRPVVAAARVPVHELDRITAVLAAVVGDDLGPGATVTDLAALAGVSVRSLQRTFARWVGVSPKWVLQRHRVHLAADLLAADPGCDLADVAARVGYYDQAHFTSDFARALGQTPGAFARVCRATRAALAPSGG